MGAADLGGYIVNYAGRGGKPPETPVRKGIYGVLFSRSNLTILSWVISEDILRGRRSTAPEYWLSPPFPRGFVFTSWKNNWAIA